MINKSAPNAQQLKTKYNFIFFLDREEKKVRRVVEVKWSKRIGALGAQHTLVTQLVASYTGNDAANNTPSQNTADYEPYYINETLFKMIWACPAPYNSDRNLIV